MAPNLACLGQNCTVGGWEKSIHISEPGAAPLPVQVSHRPRTGELDLLLRPEDGLVEVIRRS